MEDKIINDAIEFAKVNKKELLQKIFSIDIKSEERPVSVFMAGGPGAGKTEFSKNLFENKSKDFLRIDPDEYRKLFAEYRGDNSHLFQGATSLLASKAQDLALKKGYSYIFDSTFSQSEEVCFDNIERSINKLGRTTQIIYIFQKPEIAWEFTKAREKVEGRKIKKEDFISCFLSAKNNVNEVKEKFGKKVTVDIVKKNIGENKFEYFDNIDKIDNYIKFDFTKEKLSDILK